MTARLTDVDAVFLDIDNTLLDFSACSAWAIERTCADLNVPYSLLLTETFQLVNEVFWRDIEKGILTREDVFRVRFDMTFQKLGLPVGKGAHFDDVYRAYLCESAFTVTGAKDLLAYLAPRYKLYAASNALAHQQRKRLAKAELLNYFSGLLISDELGAEKPRKAFFDACFARLGGISPSRTVMIGDSPNADVLGAKNYGMKAVWFNHRGRKRPSPVADFTVNTLAEIQSLL